MRRHLRSRMLIIVVLALVAIIVPFALLQGAGPPPFLPSAPPDTIAPATRLPANADTEAIMQRLEKEGRIIRTQMSGPETAGSTIEVTGKQIKLPDDPSVLALVATVTCIVGMPCPESPVYVLKRGNPQVGVETGNGKLWNEVVAPEDVRPFEFLKEGLK